MSTVTDHATSELPISPLFGEVAMDLAICPPSEVVDALCLQEQLRAFGLRTERLGQILVERGALRDEDVARILAEMEERTRILRVPGYRSLIENLMVEADREYARAFEAMPALPGFFKGPVAVAASVYRGIHDEIRKNGYNNLTRRGRTSLVRKLRLGMEGLLQV